MSFDLTFPADSNTITATGNTDGNLVTFSEDVTVTAVMVYAAGWLSPRIYDGSTQALLASGPRVQPTDATVLTRMPLTSPVVLTAGHPYLIGYFRDVSSPNTLVKQCTSVTSASASGTTMAASGGDAFYYTGRDAWPVQTQAGALLSLGVEATAAATGGTATAAQTLPAVTQAAAGTTTLPVRHAAAAQTLPAITQSAVATAPFSITVTADGLTVTITWAEQPGATAYAVKRDGAIIDFDVTGPPYVDTPAEAGTYTYDVGVRLT